MNRRDQGDGSIYQLADGRWRAALQVGFVGGKRRRRTWTGATKAEVKAKLTAAQKLIAKGLSLAGEKETIGQFAARWLADPPLGLRPNSVRIYESIARLHVVPSLGHIKVSRLALTDVRGHLTRELALGRTASGVARDLKFLRRLLADAMREEVIARNVATLVQAPTVPKLKVDPLTPAEVRKFLAATKGNRLHALYQLAIALGLRSGEARGLRWEDVDLDAGVLSVRNQMQRISSKKPLAAPGKLVGDTTWAATDKALSPVVGTDIENGADDERPRALAVPKRGSPSRVVPAVIVLGAVNGYYLAELKSEKSRRALNIPAVVLPEFRAHRQRQREEHLAAGPAWQGDKWGLVFCTEAGLPIHAGTLQAQFARALTSAGIRPQRFHDLRHAAASFMLAAGARMDVVRDVMGHSAIAVTVDTYGHLLPDVAREATERASELWGTA